MFSQVAERPRSSPQACRGIQRSRLGRDAARSCCCCWPCHQFSSQCHRRLCRNKEWRTLCSDKVNLQALAPGARLKHTAAPRLSSMRRCCFLILHACELRRSSHCPPSTALLGDHCDPTAAFQRCAWYHHQMRYSDETCDACQSPIAEHLCPFSPGRDMDGMSIDDSSPIA